MALNVESCDSLPPDEEPKLKYNRMENDVKNILLKDAASCICVHTKFICIGTQWGTVHLLDHEGNTVSIGTQAPKDRKELQAHTIAVNQISVDQSGEYIATCSDDGKVLVYGLYSSDNNQTITHGYVIKSIALDPLYFKSGSGRRFLTGDTKLTINEKTFLNRLRSTVLSECEGYVQNIAWQGRFVAWAGDMGVRVHDLVPKCSLGLIKWERNILTSIEDYRCNLLWAAEKTLMIGWVDTVRICVIRKRSSLELQTRDVPEYLVDPMYTFQTDYYICGLGPLGEQLVLLGLPKDKDPITGKSQRPFLCIADYQGCEFTEVSTDSLNIRGYEEYSCNEYHLDQLIEENRFFIASPKDIVVASPYDIDDRVNWLMDNGRYEKAMSVLENYGSKTTKHSVSDVGIKYIDYLLAQHLFQDAAILCAKICKNDKALWKNQVDKFHEVNQLRVISDYVPKSLENKLSHIVYEMILNEYLISDPQGFLKMVQDWNPALYNTIAIINSVYAHLVPSGTAMSNHNMNERCNPHILEALAVLYCYEKKYETALQLYLKLQHKEIFTIIRNHNMYSVINNNILALMKLDCDKTISILLDKCKVPPENVEAQLKGNDIYLFRYLDAYNKVNTNGLYQGKLVRLYAEYAREKLLPFLRSRNYNIEEALDVCYKKNLYPERVYLLGRSGKTKEALQIILEKLSDINQAISFCQEHNDKELWMDLINYSIEKPEYVTLLLKRIGNFVDPTLLIKSIKPETEIQDLKDSLAKMMCDCNLQLSVQEAYKSITFQNYFELHEKLIGNHDRGICITDDLLCSICHSKIIINDLSHASELRVYNCRHSYHMSCLPDNLQIENCALCNAVKL